MNTPAFTSTVVAPDFNEIYICSVCLFDATFWKVMYFLFVQNKAEVFQMSFHIAEDNAHELFIVLWHIFQKLGGIFLKFLPTQTFLFYPINNHFYCKITSPNCQLMIKESHMTMKQSTHWKQGAPWHFKKQTK